MTAPHPFQLHLFDAQPDPAEVPLECRLRLLRLTGELLQEAARSETPTEKATSKTEVSDE